MTSWMRNQLRKLYNTLSAPVPATLDALAERLQSVRETASLLVKRGIMPQSRHIQTAKVFKYNPQRCISLLYELLEWFSDRVSKK